MWRAVAAAGLALGLAAGGAPEASCGSQPPAAAPRQDVSLLQTRGSFQAGQPALADLSEGAPAQGPPEARGLSAAQVRAPFDVGDDAVPLSRDEAREAPWAPERHPASMVQQSLVAAAQGSATYTRESVYGPQAPHWAEDRRLGAERLPAATPQRDIEGQLARQARLVQDDDRRERELQRQQQEELQERQQRAAEGRPQQQEERPRQREQEQPQKHLLQQAEPPQLLQQREQASAEAAGAQPRAQGSATATVAPLTQPQRQEEADGAGTPRVQEALARLHEQQQQLQRLEQILLRNRSLRAHQERIEAARAAGTSEYQPVHEHCSPRCSYTCETPECDEECGQVCESPTCQTRCKAVDLSGCRMDCGKPHCAVICPEEACMDEECPRCVTKCSEPMCMLQCPKAQPCHNECEQPRCEWRCRAPSKCPEPVCRMECETQHRCVGSTFRELPPLREGEVAVQSFAAPAGGSVPNLVQEPGQQGLPQTIRVPVASPTSAAAAGGAAQPPGLVDIPVLASAGR